MAAPPTPAAPDTRPGFPQSRRAASPNDLDRIPVDVDELRVGCDRGEERDPESVPRLAVHPANPGRIDPRPVARAVHEQGLEAAAQLLDGARLDVLGGQAVAVPVAILASALEHALQCTGVPARPEDPGARARERNSAVTPERGGATMKTGRWIMESARSAENGLARAERRQHPLGDRVAGEADLLADQRGLAVGDVAVGQPHAHHAGTLAPALGEGVLGVLEHAGTDASREHVLLDRDKQLVLGGEPLDQLTVQRLGEAGIGDRGSSPRPRRISAASRATWTP